MLNDKSHYEGKSNEIGMKNKEIKFSNTYYIFETLSLRAVYIRFNFRQNKLILEGYITETLKNEISMLLSSQVINFYWK